MSRDLPAFLILGAPKCATTSLATALRDHPDLCIPERKELFFFDTSKWQRGLTWYAEQFEGATPTQLLGEATPTYFGSLLAAERLARTNPACKLIVVARDPVARFHSHYWYHWNSGIETRSVERALADELASTDPESGYLLRHGMYGKNLRRYRELFGEGSVYVVLFEELVKDPQRVLAECQRFIGVTQHALAFAAENTAAAPRNMWLQRKIQELSFADNLVKKVWRIVLPENRRRAIRQRLHRLQLRPIKNPPLPDAVKTQLKALFRDDILDFQAQIGKDLRAWLA